MFDTAKDLCLMKVLRMLEKERARYSEMFRQTRASHETLQNILRYLLERKFISKEEKGYGISEEGKRLLGKLLELEGILK